MKCPNCGAEVDGKFCEFCGSELQQSNASVSITNNYYGSASPQHSSPINNNAARCPRCGKPTITFKRERVGTITNSRSYKKHFIPGRKGRAVSQAAYRTIGICKNCGCTWDPDSAYPNSQRNKKTWLWVLGWLFLFPLPLTILLLRNKTMNPKVKYSVIAVAWVLFLLIGIFGNTSEVESADNNKESGRNAESSLAAESNIQSLAFLNTDDVIVKIGKTYSSGYLKVTINVGAEFSPEDVLFVSSDSKVASINFTHDALNTFLYYEIIGIGPGETEVYAISKDGKIESQRIKVVVPAPIEIEKITVTPENSELLLGETASTSVSIYPENAEDQTLIWNSSDVSVATVDSSGIITAVGEGSTIITASATNGVSNSFEITVDGEERVMNLSVSRIRQDDNNIGDDWSYTIELNDEGTSRTQVIAVGDVLKFHVKISENDDNPDIGEVSSTHIVTEEEFTNGFEVSLDVFITENGGKNSGKQAHYIVTYTFTP